MDNFMDKFPPMTEHHNCRCSLLPIELDAPKKMRGCLIEVESPVIFGTPRMEPVLASLKHLRDDLVLPDIIIEGKG